VSCEPTSHGSACLQQVGALSLAAGVLGPGGGGLHYNSLSAQGLGATVVCPLGGSSGSNGNDGREKVE
jgi:hypothetical protein